MNNLEFPNLYIDSSRTAIKTFSISKVKSKLVSEVRTKSNELCHEGTYNLHYDRCQETAVYRETRIRISWCTIKWEGRAYNDRATTILRHYGIGNLDTLSEITRDQKKPRFGTENVYQANDKCSSSKAATNSNYSYFLEQDMQDKNYKFVSKVSHLKSRIDMTFVWPTKQKAEVSAALPIMIPSKAGLAKLLIRLSSLTVCWLFVHQQAEKRGKSNTTKTENIFFGPVHERQQKSYFDNNAHQNFSYKKKLLYKNFEW